VADSLVVTDRDSAVVAAIFKPLFVPTVGREEVVVPFYLQAGIDQNRGKPLPEVAVREKDELHAARS
jgi:hypothetical protein